MNAIWLVAGGAMQEIAAQKIIDSGFKLILTDPNPSCACAKYASELIGLDTFDIQGNVKTAKKIKSKYRIKAVLTVAADCHETVAHLAKTLKLPGLDWQISHTCRYKFKLRDVLTKAGIAQPEFKKVSSLSEARKAIKVLGLPVVVKSTNNSGSRGFAKVDASGHLTREIFDEAKSMGTTGCVIIEQLLQPLEKEIAEQSVETLWWHGKMYWLNWVDRLFRKDFLLFKNLETNLYSHVSWGIELGHINPAIHDERMRAMVYDQIYRAGVAIGMGRQNGCHVLKADILLTQNGPYILELTPRLSGGWDSSGTTPRRGADFIGGAIRLALGEKPDLDLWTKYFRYSNSNLFSSVLTFIDVKAKNCVGRKFAEGHDFERETSVGHAYRNLREGKYITPFPSPGGRGEQR